MVDPEQQKTFVVAVRDCEEGDEANLEKLVGERLEAIWAAAVKPEVSSVQFTQLLPCWGWWGAYVVCSRETTDCACRRRHRCRRRCQGTCIEG